MRIPMKANVKRRLVADALSTYSKSAYFASPAERGVYRRVGNYGRYGQGQEKKFFDTIKANTTVSAAGTLFSPSLNLIPQGTTEKERIGRLATVKNLYIKGEVRMPAQTASSATHDRVRIIVYVDKQTNGTGAAVLDLLETASINSFRNLTNITRFDFVQDRVINLNCVGGAGNGTADSWGEFGVNYRFSKRCNMPVEFDSTAGAITEIRSNNIGVMAISANGSATLLYTARVRFTG